MPEETKGEAPQMARQDPTADRKKDIRLEKAGGTALAHGALLDRNARSEPTRVGGRTEGGHAALGWEYITGLVAQRTK